MVLGEAAYPGHVCLLQEYLRTVKCRCMPGTGNPCVSYSQRLSQSGRRMHSPSCHCLYCDCASPCCPADAVGIDPSAAAKATPKPTAETIDSNRLSEVEEGKDTPDVFVRKETVSGAPSGGQMGSHAIRDRVYDGLPQQAEHPHPHAFYTHSCTQGYVSAVIGGSTGGGGATAALLQARINAKSRGHLQLCVGRGFACFQRMIFIADFLLQPQACSHSQLVMTTVAKLTLNACAHPWCYCVCLLPAGHLNILITSAPWILEWCLLQDSVDNHLLGATTSGIVCSRSLA